MGKKTNQLAWWLLWASLMCCVFEGAFRKWSVGDTSVIARLAYLSKDIMLALFVVLGRGRPSTLTRTAQPLLLFGFVLLALGATASIAAGINIIGAVLTIRTFFILPLAAWSAARLLPAHALQWFALWIVLLSLPMSVLSVRQFYSPANSVINRYSTVGEDVSTSGVSERVRATGTFSYISGFGEFATTAVWAAIVTFTLARTHWHRWLGFAGLIAGFCCAFVTVSRSVALVSLGLLAVWAFAGGKYGRKAQFALTIAALLFLVMSITEQWDAATEIATTVHSRHMAVNDSLSHRLWYQYIHPLDSFELAPFGNGLGFEQIQTSDEGQLGRVQWTFESAWGRTVMETGILGILGFLVILASVFIPLTTAYRGAPWGERKTVLALTFAALLLRALVGFQFNHVAAYFFWSMAAVTLAIHNSPVSMPHLPAPVRVRWDKKGLAPVSM